MLAWIIVAPVTRSVGQIPTHVPLGPGEGLGAPRVAALDNPQPIRRSFLTGRTGAPEPFRRTGCCRALRALADC